MPRFAVAATVLLIGIMGAAAATMWYGGWSPGLRVLEAANAAGSADPGGQQDLVGRASAAIKTHDVAAIRRYLADGGNPDAADAEGETLLNKTVLHGTPEILDVLLAAGADPNLTGKNELGPLTIAALSGRHAMLEQLMRANSGELVAGAATGRDSVHATASAAPGGPAAAPALDASRASQPRPAERADSPPAPTTAGLASEGELPAEPYASMAGLSVSPIPRPLPGGTAVASTGADAPEVSPPAAPATSGTSPVAGSVPQEWASAAQRRLSQLGYYKGPITGYAGSLTAEAVKRYQAVAGIPQDGVVSADLLRRIGVSVEAPRKAPAPAAAPSPAGSATAPAEPGDPAQAASRGLQEVRNALGQQFNSATRPDALRQHCQANTNAWIYDEAIGRSLFCRDVIGSPPH